MKADSLKIAKVFSSGGDVHYVLPHFQREYAWERDNWLTLINDVFSVYEAYDDEKEPEHFMGALVVINDGTRNGTVPAFKLVDGQQRLTTISLFLCALGRLIKDSHSQIFKKIQRLVTNPDEEGLLRYKLLPTAKYGDRDVYLAVIDGEKIDYPVESRIPGAYEFLYKQLENRLNRQEFDPEILFKVLTNCLQVVFIDLDQRERPYEIFESLNHKGKILSQADLVRNYIAMKLPENKQEFVFQKSWAHVEDLLRENRTVARIGELTAFLRHYLAYHKGILFNKDHIYARFRDRIEVEFPSVDEFISEIETLKRFAIYYDYLLRPEKVEDAKIREALKRLNILELATAYPFLLAAFEAMHQNDISDDAFVEGLTVLENYMVRRYVAGEPTNYLNKMFPALWREIDKSRYVESLRQALLTKNYPSDNRVTQALLGHQMYDKRSNQRIYLILDSINRHLSSGSGARTILDGEPTIEHILPQSDEPSWKRELGDEWEEAYREYLHTIGNLTLVTQEWNSSLSNSPFSVKKQKLKSHGLKLNQVYFTEDISRWDIEAIQKRTRWIAKNIFEIWPAFGEPTLTNDGTGQKPRLLTIGGDSYEVNSWREVAYQTAVYIASLVDDFDRIAQDMPTFFSREERPRSRQMENGWWIYLNLSSNSVRNLCSRVISAAELADDDWQVEFDERL